MNFLDGTNTIDNDGNESTDWTGNKDYQTARTPFLQSQLVNGARYKLFRVYTRSHGTDINKDIKVTIRDIKPASEVPGSEYGTFSVVVRRVDTSKVPNSVFGQTVQDTDTRPNIVEEFLSLIHI